MVGPIGAATQQSDFCFHFSAQASIQTATSVPFQLQIAYTHADGSRRIRSFSQFQNVCPDRIESEEQANMAVLGLAAMQR